MKAFKNPLAQLFGIVLQKMRNTVGINSDEVASKLGLGGSSYRMIEAGSAMLHPGRSLSIIQVFDQIEFEPLCRLLVAIQVMETGSRSLEEMRNATILLSDTDPQLKKIFDTIGPVWEVASSENANKVAQFMDQQNMDLVLSEFLVTNRYFGLDTERRLDFQLNSLIEETPSVYLDFILDSLKSLRKYRLHYFPDESSNWENDNKYNFTHLHAIIRDPVGITGKDNFRRFDYNYLWQSQFESLNYIFLAEEVDAQRLKVEFQSNLKQVLREKKIKYKQELESFDEVTEQKLHFRTAPLPKKQRLSALLQQERNQEEIKVFWVFSLKNGNHIGFVSNTNTKEIFYGTTLSYRETRDMLNEFKDIWNEIG